MADRTPFDYKFSVNQGRIQPTNGGTVPDGNWVFCLGSDSTTEAWELNYGDKIELYQTITFTLKRLVRFTAYIRGTETVPSGSKWLFKWYVDSTKQGERVIAADQAFSMTDGAFNVSGVLGSATLKFTLEFVSI